jgi:hypothetical protein
MSPVDKRSLAAEDDCDRQNLEKQKVKGDKDRTVFGGILINSSHSSLRGHALFSIAAGIALAQKYDQKAFLMDACPDFVEHQAPFTC